MELSFPFWVKTRAYMVHLQHIIADMYIVIMKNSLINILLEYYTANVSHLETILIMLDRSVYFII